MKDRQSGRNGRIGKPRAPVDSNTLDDQCHPKKIFIGGLSHKTTTQHLRDHFSQLGSVVDAVVLRWPDGRSRGFGYVTFGDPVAAANALKKPHAVGGREVDVKRAVPGTNKLFVGGLPQNTNANELREHFQTYGVVSDAVVMIDANTSRSRGFGFVCFLPGQEGADAVAHALQQYETHRLRGKWIEVKSAEPPHRLASTRTPLQQVGSEELDADCADTSSGASSPPPALAAPPIKAPAVGFETMEPQKVALPGIPLSAHGFSDIGPSWPPALWGSSWWAHPSMLPESLQPAVPSQFVSALGSHADSESLQLLLRLHQQPGLLGPAATLDLASVTCPGKGW